MMARLWTWGVFACNYSRQNGKRIWRIWDTTKVSSWLEHEKKGKVIEVEVGRKATIDTKELELEPGVVSNLLRILLKIPHSSMSITLSIGWERLDQGQIGARVKASSKVSSWRCGNRMGPYNKSVGTGVFSSFSCAWDGSRSCMLGKHCPTELQASPEPGL
jgi:hypothetical protein